MDQFEQMIDVFEKLTGHSEFMEPFDTCQGAVREQLDGYEEMKEEVFKEVYEYWRTSRLENKMPLLRQFRPKPSVNDNSAFASFRSRYQDKPLTRRKRGVAQNWFDTENLSKLREMRADIIQTRELLQGVHKRETQKLQILDNEYSLFKQDNWVKEDHKDQELCPEAESLLKTGLIRDTLSVSLPPIYAPR